MKEVFQILIFGLISGLYGQPQIHPLEDFQTKATFPGMDPAEFHQENHVILKEPKWGQQIELTGCASGNEVIIPSKTYCLASFCKAA